MMLPLDSPRWHELWHARGDGDDIPALLRQLEAQRSLPPSQTEEDLWDLLWDRLEHQFTVYDASYAAVPHLMRIAGLSNKNPHYSFFLLPAAIEIRRAMGYGRPLPDDLANAYHHAIQQLPHLASQFVDAPWDEALTRSIATAVTVAKGHILLADIVMDLRPETIEEYYQWKGWSYHKLNLNDPDAAIDAKAPED
jgi:hypothetical protein